MNEFLAFCIGVVALAIAVFIFVVAYLMFKEMREEQE